MRAYKGFTEGIKSVMGNGVAEKCTFHPGQAKEEAKSKTARSGFHCCEYVMDCMGYYPMNGKNRFFVVEAEGDIDEDEHNRIACTKITLVRELDAAGIALEAMVYMIEHPDRSGWECDRVGVQVRREQAKADAPGHIAIARGRDPQVIGRCGSIVALLKEEDGMIEAAKLFRVTEGLAGKWLGLTEKGGVTAK